MAFVKAKREKIWIKMLLSGPSGCGKSYSALRVAKGLLSKVGGEGIAYIGTEGSRDKYYSDDFDYDLLQLTDPFLPENYIAAIDEAINGGYKILIIDSLSHEWKTINDIHDKMPGNSFTNWGKLKPRHRNFMEKILYSPIHVIATARGKDDWVLEEKNGKQVPKKVGMGAQQDKDISYEYSVSLQIAQDTHIASADKDNTKLFDGRYEILTENDGIRLYDWANKGDAPAQMPKPSAELSASDVSTPPDELSTTMTAIIKRCTELGGQKNTAMMDLIKTKYAKSGNPKAIKDIEKAKELLAELNSMEVSTNE